MSEGTRKIFEAMEEGGALTTPGHSIATAAVGWGEPQTLFADCSCGEEAIPVEEDFGAEGPALIPTLIPFVEKYGRDALNHGSRVFGDWETLARQCVAHMEATGGSLEARITDARERLDSAQELLQAQLAGDFGTGAQGHPVLSAAALTAAARDIEALTLAIDLTERVELPEIVPVTPESEAAYQAALKAQYPEMKGPY